MPEFEQEGRDYWGNPTKWRECIECGKGFWVRLDKNYVACQLCWNKPGAQYTTQKGDTYVKLSEDDPYYPMTVHLSLIGDGWVRKARYVMAKHRERCLEDTELVYHINKDKTDDTIGNLTLRVYAHRKRETPAQAYDSGYTEGYQAGYAQCFEEYQEYTEEHRIIATEDQATKDKQKLKDLI